MIDGARLVLYDLIGDGELAAGKSDDRLVYLRESVLKDHECRHAARAQ